MFEKLLRRKSPETITVSPTNLATLLILTMTTELQQAEQTTGMLVPVIDDIKSSYNRLLKLGMGSTQNALALRQQIEQHEDRSLDIAKAQGLIDFVKKVQAHFGPRSILVSHAAFEDLCKRYKLETGLLTDYFGVIPERNIQDIENVMQKIPSFDQRFMLNKMEFVSQLGWLLKVDSMELHDGDENIEDYIMEHDGIIRVSCNKCHFDGAWWAQDIPDLKEGRDYRWKNLTKICGTILKPDVMFIACPKKYLKNPDIKVSKLPVDPAIFQYTPFGILVHTVWGEEAEDAALAQFMELNARIAQS